MSPVFVVGHLVSGEGEGEAVYGSVWEGRDMRRFAESVGVDPRDIGNKLRSALFVGKHVLAAR